MYSIIRPILFNLPPETAHEFALNSLRIGLSSQILQQKFAEKYTLSPFGEIELFNLKFKNPVGIAAGFDKNGIVVNQLASLGFAFVEVGTTTFHPQKGNEKPRLFRLPPDKALINRAGFNNEGTAKVVAGLKKSRPHNCILGMNIGKNKDVANENAIENYLASFDLVHEIADYIVVNVSSPNTPNLRELQRADALENLLSALQRRNSELSKVSAGCTHDNRRDDGVTPLLVKIAPDLQTSEIEAITDIAMRLKLSGIIATNTTISRANLKTSPAAIEKIGSGGVSGKPLQARSSEVISQIYRFSHGKLPIIGVGGIFTAADAFEKIAAGASLVQIYTGFVYEGWTLARDINEGLGEIFKEKGFTNFQESIGTKLFC